MQKGQIKQALQGVDIANDIDRTNVITREIKPKLQVKHPKVEELKYSAITSIPETKIRMLALKT